MKGIKRLLSLAMAGALLLGTNLSEALAGSAKSVKLSDAAADSGDSIQAVIDALQKSTDKEASKEKSQDKKESAKSEKEDSAKSDGADKKNADTEKEVHLTLSISKPSDLSVSGGVYQVDPSKVSTLTLSWKCKGECDDYEVTVSGGVYSGSTGKTSVKLSVGDLSAGKYTATVKAIRDGKTVAKEKLVFEVVASKDEEAAQDSQEEPEAQVAEDVQPVEDVQASEEDKPADEAHESGDDEPVEDVQSAEDIQPVEDAQDSKDESPAEDAPESKEAPSAEVVQSSGDDELAEAPEASEDDESDEAPEVSGDDQDTESDVQPEADAQDGVKSVDDTESTDEAQPADAAQAPVEDQPAAEAQDNPEEQTADSQSAESDTQEEQDDQIVEVEDVPEESFTDVPVGSSEELVVQAPELVDDAQADDEQPVAEEFQETANEAVANAPGEAEKTDNTLTLSVMGAQGVTVVGGAVHVNPVQAGSVTFSWKFGGSCDEYSVKVSGNAYNGVTKDMSAVVSVANLAAGQYTATVAAVKDGKKLASARMDFQVDAGEIADDELVVTITSPQGLLITDGVYQIDPTQADALGLAWQFGGECDGYNVSVSGDAYSSRTGDTALSLPLAGLSEGTYTVTVTALNGEETAAQATLDFNIAGEEQGSQDQQGEGGGQQGGQPAGGSAPKGGGSRSGSAKGGDDAEVDQGFHVTPGEALVSTHTSGTRDMRLYGAVALTLDNDGMMTWLTLGGTPLDIRLDDDSPFTASIEDDTLTLTPEGEAQAWLLNGYALKTLARSGIETLRLALNDETVDFSTQPALTGSNYGALCAAGRTSRDYSFAVYADGCRVTVAEQTFLLTESGELV